MKGTPQLRRVIVVALVLYVTGAVELFRVGQLMTAAMLAGQAFFLGIFCLSQIQSGKSGKP